MHAIATVKAATGIALDRVYDNGRFIRAMLLLLLALAPLGGCDVVDLPTGSSASFMKVFGGLGDDEGSAVRQAPDGGYIIVGTTSSFGHGGRDILLIKTDASGNEQWMKTFGGTGDDVGRDLDVTSDGGFIVVGSTSSAELAKGLSDVYLLRTTSTGDTIWTRQLHQSSDSGISVQQTSDGGFVIGAEYQDPQRGSTIWVAKLSSDGRNEEWRTILYGNNSCACARVIELSTGKFLAVGNYPAYGVWAALNADGSVQSSLTSIQELSTINDAHDLGNGAFIVVGTSHHTLTSTDSLWIFRYDMNAGEIVWERRYGGDGNTLGTSFVITRDRGFAIAGNSQAVGAGNTNGFVLEMSDSGAVLWSRPFGFDLNEITSGIAQASDGGFVVIASSESFRHDLAASDILLIKFDPMGRLR